MQSLTQTYFEQTASYWDQVYDADDVWGAIYRQRQAITLAWIDQLGIEKESKVLEIGCGAGLVAVALAQKGFRVRATDSVAAMITRTRERVASASLSDRVTVTLADAHSLDLEDRTFSLAVALGVIPWVRSPLRMVQEMARVVKSGGHLIVTADNRMRLTHLLDPACSPPLSRLVRPAAGLVRAGLRRPVAEVTRATMHTPAEVDSWLASAGLVKVASATFGFGPFTLLGRNMMPAQAGTWLHWRLEALAAGSAPILGSTGAQYIVMARKERLLDD